MTPLSGLINDRDILNQKVAQFLTDVMLIVAMEIWEHSCGVSLWLFRFWRRCSDNHLFTLHSACNINNPGQSIQKQSAELVPAIHHAMTFYIEANGLKSKSWNLSVYVVLLL